MALGHVSAVWSQGGRGGDNVRAKASTPNDISEVGLRPPSRKEKRAGGWSFSATKTTNQQQKSKINVQRANYPGDLEKRRLGWATCGGGVCRLSGFPPPFLNKRGDGGERRSELRLLRLGATLHLRSSITARWLRAEDVPSTPKAWKPSVAPLKGPVCELQARLPT